MERKRWVFVAAGTFILLFAGLVYAWSVLSRPIAAEFSQWSTGQLSLTFTLTMTCFCLGVFTEGLIADRIKARYVLWAAAALFVVGFLIASGANSLPALYFGFGVLAGFASGLTYNSIMDAVTKWFPDKQGLISGILLMGFGIGSFLIGKVYTALLSDSVSWRLEFRILGIILCIVLALSGLVIHRPTKEQFHEFAKNRKTSSGDSGVIVNFKPLQMLRQSSFWLYFLWSVLMSAAGLALIAQASGIVMEVSPSLAANSVATIVGLISIFNGAGRVAFGEVYDRLGNMKCMMINNALYLISILVIIAALRSGSLTLLVVAFICFGLSYGGVTPTNSAIVSDFFGTLYYPLNFSIVLLNLIIASFGATLAGMVYDAQGTYTSIFLIMIGAVVIGTVATALIRKPKNLPEQSKIN